MINDSNQVALVVILKDDSLQMSDHDQKDTIRSKIKAQFPSHYEPSKILLFESGKLPTTRHGKHRHLVDINSGLWSRCFLS